MCAVGEKLIRLPENCGVVDYFVKPRDVTQEYDYPEIEIRLISEIFDNPDFIANFDVWMDTKKPPRLKSDGGMWFIVKAPGVKNWCAECNVMQALPCFQFRCAACDNKHWEKYMIVHAFYEWRELIDHTRDYDAREDEDYEDYDTYWYPEYRRGYDWNRSSWDDDPTYKPWRGCHMQD
jgi:hypothetical protein